MTRPRGSSPTGTSPQADTEPTLLDGYRPPAGHGDRVFDANRQVRPNWAGLSEFINLQSPRGFEARRERAQRELDDNGILFTGEGETAHPHLWPLDPVPFPIPKAQFDPLAEAVEQRAALLNRLAADLLGPQRVLKEKILPPALLYANPHFRRAYLDLPVAGGRYLHLYSVDLFSDAPGRWWVQGDRTQAPSGLGFTLENRLAVARVHQDWYSRTHVQRHAGFFRDLRETLAGLAPRNQDNPLVVLLSEGLTGHRGFEDAFLARYLGYTLVVGEDLASREGQIVLKTLGGTIPVEVIFRRVNDDTCDPVELDGSSTLGVAGLVESNRTEQLSIANTLGSQIVEAPGLMPFFRALCRFYFAEDLKLPSLATWWCGQKQEREYVLEHLDELVIRPAFDSGAAPVSPAAMPKERRQRLIERIHAKPEMFVGQQTVVRGTAPVWTGSSLEPWNWTLRCFAAMRGDGYHVLPGGLVRLSQQGLSLDGGPRPGERTQDCWIIDDEPVEPVTLLPQRDHPIALRRSGGELPSRVADNLFWLGRSIETAEAKVRLLRASIDLADVDHPAHSGWLQSALLGLIKPERAGMNPPPDTPGQRIREAVLGPPSAGNLRDTMRECLRLVQAVRDRVSMDAWRLVTRIDRHLARTAASPSATATDLAELALLLNRVVLELVGFGGLMSESMTRTLGWRFLDMGRRMQRATHTGELLQAVLVQPGPDERLSLQMALEICDSHMTYRSRYLADLQPAPVIDLLLTDEINPRSVSYQLHQIEQHLAQMPREHNPSLRDADQRQTLELLSALRLANPYALARGHRGRRDELGELLTKVHEGLPLIDRALSGLFLVHTRRSTQFASLDPRNIRDIPPELSSPPAELSPSRPPTGPTSELD